MGPQDQLLEQKQLGHIFRFLHEPPINFAPTYKFDKGDPNRLAYDSSDKQRVPAWTDRVLFRGSELTRGVDTRPQFHGTQSEARLEVRCFPPSPQHHAFVYPYHGVHDGPPGGEGRIVLACVRR